MGDFLSHLTLKFDGCPWKNNMASLLYYVKLCASFQSHRLIETGVTFWKPSIRVQLAIFVPCDLEIWRMTLQNKVASLLCDFKLGASFNGHGWIQTGVTVKKRPILRQNQRFLCRLTLKFDGWPWKTIKHPSYATFSSVHHFIVICEFKLELSSANGLIGFWPQWPRPLTSDLCLLHGHHFCQG